MKIKKYIRTKDNNILKENDCKILQIEGKWFLLTPKGYNEIIASADTPQELVRKKDMIIYKDINDRTHYDVICSEVEIPLYISGEKALRYRDQKGLMGVLEFKYITKILTPNSQGDYIKQWEKGE